MRRKWSETKGTHGRSGTPEFWVWVNMISRCCNPKHPSHESYGGRGIDICPDWRVSFAAFLEDVGPRPSAKHSIERVNNNRGYWPDNVKWATRKEQMRNTRATHFIVINGIAKTVTEWATEKGISATTIHHRIQRGMREQDAVLLTPREGGRRISKRVI